MPAATSSVVAIVPARGGSKGVVRKNVRRVGGRPLIARSVEALEASGVVDRILVSTDDDEIAAIATAAGAEQITRPADLATDTASSESALVHAIEALAEAGDRPDTVVFVQCTSPFIEPASIARAVRTVREGRADVVFSVIESHGFLWRERDGGHVGVNHDLSVRQRRQDRPTEYLETGAFYVMRTDGFLAGRHRFFGRVDVEVVAPEHAIEIDTEVDLDLAVALARSVDPLGRRQLDGVRGLVTDFDGVHTDNTATVDEKGVESVGVNRSDGMGISLGRRAGLPILILSTEQNPVVRARARKLGVECEHGHDDKLAVLAQWAARHDLDPRDIAYIGNDVNDLGCLEWVGWPIVVADAHPDVAARGYSTTTLPGGAGAVREVIDWIIGASTMTSSPEHGDAERSAT